MNLGFEFHREAAKPKRASDDAPTQVPMRGSGSEVRRKPSADQKKVRRQMARQQRRTAASETPSKENPMSRQREAEILQAMAKADLPEQRRLAQELDALRAEASMQVQAERDLDLADTVIRDTLTPVRVHERHTASTDWITEVPTVVEGSYDHDMRTEATLWFGKVHEAVKADREEFAEQAKGMARRMAGKYGEAAPAAAQVFLDTAARLHRIANEDNGHAESTVTDYETKADQDPLYAEDWPGNEPEGVHPPLPGAGEAANSIETPTAARKTAVSLTNVGIEGDHGVGTDPSGNRVKFNLSEKDKADLKAILYSDLAVNFSGVDVDESDIIKDAAKTASEDQTCSVCGDKIAKDPSGEEPSTWHHDNGEKHDHEAKPSGESKESVRKHADGPTHTFPCKDCGTTVERWRGEYDVNCPSCGAPHNAGGQRLRDDYAGNPSMYDDEIGDLEGFEMQHAHDAAKKTAYSAPDGKEETCGTCGKKIVSMDYAWYHLAKDFPNGEDHNAHPNPHKGASLQTTAARPIHRIADDIVKEWGVGNINFAARPYLDAMRYLESINDSFGAEPAKHIIAYFLSNAASFRGGRAKELKDELRAIQKGASKEAGGRNDFSLSDAKNEDGEWIMSPEQIRAEMSADERDPYDDYDDDRYASRRQAANPDGPEGQDGNAESSLPLGVEVGSEGDRPMWPWELNEETQTSGASDVAGVATPGGESGYPQPKSSSVIPAQGRVTDFRARVQAGLARAEEAPGSRHPFVREASGGWVDAARRIVQNSQHEEVDGVLLDLFSANVMLQVHDALGPEAQAKFAAMPLTQAHDIAFKLLDKQSAKTAMPNPVDLGISVGDIFYSSWGYDQTNIDFYEVTGLTGASVRLRPVRSRQVASDGFHDQVVPVPGQYTGGEFLKRLQSYSDRPSVSLNSYSNAYLWDGTPKSQTNSMAGH